MEQYEDGCHFEVSILEVTISESKGSQNNYESEVKKYSIGNDRKQNPD